MVPSRIPAKRPIHFVAMLTPAATNAAAVKYAQNMADPGIQAGTRLAITPRTRKWSMPKITEQTTLSHGAG